MLKWFFFFLGACRSGRIGNSKPSIRQSRSFVATWFFKNCLQICNASVKFGWYLYFFSFSFPLDALNFIIAKTLYIISLDQISCFTKSAFFEWKYKRPTVYFSVLNDVSIPHLMLYNFPISNAEKSDAGKFVIKHSYSPFESLIFTKRIVIS